MNTVAVLAFVMGDHASLRVATDDPLLRGHLLGVTASAFQLDLTPDH
jgi:hypothetical protein